jgi:hypothetical protein
MTTALAFAAAPWRERFTVHPCAEVFPLMSEDELAALALDIQTHGLRSPITLWTDPADSERTFVLDGRNRLNALERNGERLRPEHLTTRHDADPAAFVISANIKRRHLSKTQQAELIVAALAAAISNDHPNTGRSFNPIPGKRGGSSKDPLLTAALIEGKKHGIGRTTITVTRAQHGINTRAAKTPTLKAAVAPSLAIGKNWRTGLVHVTKRNPALGAAMQASPNQHGVQMLCSGAGMIQGHFPKVWQFVDRLDPERFIALGAAAAAAGRTSRKWCDCLATLPSALFERGVALAIAGTLDDALDHRRPIPSRFYPGIDTSLDAWLLKEHRETDHELLEPLSRVDGWAKQRAFVERYLTQGREHAEATITIPDYKWLLVNGTEDDRQAWQFLRVCHTYFKLGPDAMNILTGALHRMTDKAKWLRVLDSYTGALNRGEAIDVATAPWEVK